MSDIKDVLGKKPKVQDEDKKMAKMKALKELRGAMSSMDGEGIGKAMSMKKVTVAAPDDAKLKEGLDKAKELVDKEPEDMMDAESAEDEMCESPAEESAESEDILKDMDSVDQIDELMRKLEEKKAQLKK